MSIPGFFVKWVGAPIAVVFGLASVGTGAYNTLTEDALPGETAGQEFGRHTGKAAYDYSIGFFKGLWGRASGDISGLANGDATVEEWVDWLYDGTESARDVTLDRSGRAWKQLKKRLADDDIDTPEEIEDFLNSKGWTLGDKDCFPRNAPGGATGTDLVFGDGTKPPCPEGPSP